MMYVRASDNRRKNVLLRFWICVIVFLLLMLLMDSFIEMLIYDNAVSVCRNKASVLINNAVLEAIDEDDDDYQDFVNVISSENGDVQYIAANADEINVFKSKIGKKILDVFDSEEIIAFDVPIGTLLDVGVLYERGPKINFRLKLYGDVNTYIDSRFTSVGINQTKHSIICRVEANIAIITPSFTIHTPITGEYLIAETVVIGNVPDSYTNVNGDDSDIIGKIFDYADME